MSRFCGEDGFLQEEDQSDQKVTDVSWAFSNSDSPIVQVGWFNIQSQLVKRKQGRIWKFESDEYIYMKK